MYAVRKVSQRRGVGSELWWVKASQKGEEKGKTWVLSAFSAGRSEGNCAPITTVKNAVPLILLKELKIWFKIYFFLCINKQHSGSQWNSTATCFLLSIFGRWNLNLLGCTKKKINAQSSDHNEPANTTVTISTTSLRYDDLELSSIQFQSLHLAFVVPAIFLWFCIHIFLGFFIPAFSHSHENPTQQGGAGWLIGGIKETVTVSKALTAA